MNAALRRFALLAGLAAPAALASACDEPAAAIDEVDGPRTLSERDHLSLVAPEGWTMRRDRDALVFSPAPGSASPRATIVVRSAPVEGEASEARTPPLVFAATGTWLRGSLLEARVSGPHKLDRRGFEGVAFTVHFKSRENASWYERRHVVLIPEGGTRVFHVLHTAPVTTGELDATRAEFDTVVASIREEV